MDTEVLKTFLEVNRTRHFGKAAENLYVTQSTVSARIAQLETILGSPVFVRSRNDLQLTAAGQRLLRHAENILTTWNRARQEIAVNYDTSRVPLSVGGVPSLWDTLLQGWLETVYGQTTELALYAEVLNADVMSRRLRDRTLDLAFMFDPPQVSDLHIAEIATVSLILVSSKENNTARNALQENYILVDWGSLFAGTHARYFPDIPTPALRINQGRVARDFLLNCGGSAYLPELMVRESISNGALFPVPDAPVIKRPAYAVYPLDSDKETQINTSLGYFEQSLP